MRIVPNDLCDHGKEKTQKRLSAETETLDTLLSFFYCFTLNTVCTVPTDMCDYERENPQKRSLIVNRDTYGVQCWMMCVIMKKKTPEETVNRDWNIGHTFLVVASEQIQCVRCWMMCVIMREKKPQKRLSTETEILDTLFSFCCCFTLNTVPNDMCDYEKETPQKRLSTETETLDTNFFFLAIVVSD